MSELKDYSILDIEAIDDERHKTESAPGKWVPESRVYLKSEADKVIAEKDMEIFNLKEELSYIKADSTFDRDEYEELLKSKDAEIAEKDNEIRRLKRALWLARAERYKMREFIAREEGNLSNQMSWSRILRERTYDQWVGQLLRIANLANKLQNKCRAKAEEY